MFRVYFYIDTAEGRLMLFIDFDTEREARAYINQQADGERVFWLWGPKGELIVESRFPVLMVA
jgi:hypothetical protein